MLDAWTAPRRAAIERWLDARFDDAWPREFGRASVYPLATGGKRIRPLLCLATAEALGVPWERALDAAGAIELIHTYSLVHDDLPAMDNADTRREKPTVHKVWNDAAAVLVGDGLLTEAFSVVARADYTAEQRVGLVRLYADAAGYRGMVGGQAADIGIGGRIRSLDDLERLHRLKTGALIEAAVLAGAVVSAASTAQVQSLAEYGRDVGLAFQLADDLLDKDEDQGDSGPPSFVALLGEAETRRRAHLLADRAVDRAREAVGHRAEILAALAQLAVLRTH